MNRERSWRLRAAERSKVVHRNIVGLVMAGLLAWSINAAGPAKAGPSPDGPEPAAPVPDWVLEQWRGEQAYLEALIAEKRKRKVGPADYVYHPQATVYPEDRDPTDVVLRRTRALLAEIRASRGAPDLASFDKSLASLEQKARPDADEGQRGRLFLALCALRRQIAFANPLLQFDEILFMLPDRSDPYMTHASGGGPTTSQRIPFGWSGGYGFGGGSAIPPHLRNRVGYLNDDRFFPPDPKVDEADFSHPRFRSALYGVDKPWYLGKTPRGLMALSNFRSGGPEVRALLQEAQVESGPFAGEPAMRGLFSHDWDLDYDGKRAVFTWFFGEGMRGNDGFVRGKGRYQIYTANLDGTGMRPLTDDIWLNMDPCILPDGRIVFRSFRRFLYNRCDGVFQDSHAPPRYCSTLFSMRADGGDIVPLSWHETNEFHPSVDNDGRLIYSRWDYIDRGFAAAHGLWHCFPDGRDPRVMQGNYYLPRYRGDPPAKSLASPDLRRSVGQFHARAIPGRQGRYVLIDGGHHRILPGTPCVVDVRLRDDDDGGPSRRILDVDLVKDSGGGAGMVTPWPLSEGFFLVSVVWTNPKDVRQRPAALPGIYLLDKFGNLEVLLADPSRKSGKTWFYYGPRPRLPRERPPVIPAATFQGERRGRPGHKRATLAVMNVYDADFRWPEGRTPTELRVVQCWGRPWSRPSWNFPKISRSNGNVARMALGRAPIEQDGSAYLEAPVGCLIFFQVLDQHGLAIQSMRTATYVHPGEQLSCAGCHEDKWNRRATAAQPLALRRPPSKLQPEAGGPYPQTYARLVKPVFEGTCIPCHRKEGQGPTDLSYRALGGLTQGAYYGNGGAGGGGPGQEPSRSTPGQLGAAASPLGKALLKTHRERLPPETLRRMTLWLDLGAPNLCDFMYEEEQLLGHNVWPWSEGDPANPQHVEHDRPLAQSVVPSGGLPEVVRLLGSPDWQQRQWGAEALRQLGPAARNARQELFAHFTGLMAGERIEEAEGLLRAFREIEPDLFDRAVSALCEVACGTDRARAARACDVLKFAGADTPTAVAAFARLLRGDAYEPAVSAGEALSALACDRWAPVAPELLKALRSPHPRAAYLAADLLRRLGPGAPPGTAPALAAALLDRSRDYTFLGKPEKELQRIPQVQERHAWFADALYVQWNPTKQQDTFRTMAQSLERSRDRELMTMCARALQGFGAEATDAAPALAHCASLDAGDQAALVEAAVKIAPVEAVRSTAALLPACSANDDKLTRLVFFIALIGEKGGTEARAAALAALAQVQGESYAAKEAATWRTLLKDADAPKAAGDARKQGASGRPLSRGPHREGGVFETVHSYRPLGDPEGEEDGLRPVEGGHAPAGGGRPVRCASGTGHDHDF